MRRPLVAALLVATAACTPAPVAPPVVASAAPTAAPAVAAPSADVATAAPAVGASPLAEASAAPSPSPTADATPSAGPSGTPAPLGEANHGDTPFPSPPAGTKAVSLASATATAGAGQASAHGAIDGEIYTEWAARAGIGPTVWLAIDLGTARKVGKVDLLADSSADVECFYNVELSADGEEWRTVAAGKALGSNDAPTWGTATFTPETTRYVRIVPTSWGSSWVAVWEVRLRE